MPTMTSLQDWQSRQLDDPEFGKFKLLYDRLHVKSKPDAYDAIKVLSEISGSKQALSNMQIEPASELAQILMATWKLLGESLDKSEIQSTYLKKELGASKTILNPSTKLLSRPDRLFFEDRPGWGEKFDLVKNNLIPRVEGAWLAMEAAGVRRISNAISTEIHECVNSRMDEEFSERLVNRRNLVQRVIDAHQSKGIKGFDLGALDSIKFESAEKIEVVRTFHAFGAERTGSSVKIEVDAIRIDSVLYYCKNQNEYPWLDIAREMTYVLYPNGDINSLGMELKEILSSPSFEIANRNFDQLGYPRIEIVDTDLDTKGPDTRPGGEQLQGDTQPTETPGALSSGSTTEIKDYSDGETKEATNGETSPTPPSVRQHKLPERKSSRLVSYVYPEGELRDEKPNGDENTKRKIEIGQLGVAKVMAHEIAENRTPQEMPPNNPGYDIKSIDKMGRTRFIEVKALTNQWDGQSPAQMTRTEFDLSKELGFSYWLYIVELVESENYKIYQIQNPANQVDSYLFDHGWKPLADRQSG